jgi:hydrogenase 3 maturation protease
MRAEHSVMSGKCSNRALKNLSEQLGKLNPAKTVIVGIGNTLKGDDGAGPHLCDILRGKIAAEIIDVGSTPENYIARIVKMSPEKLLIVDAVDFGATPGTVRIFDIKDLGRFLFSTHSLSPHLFVEAIWSEINVDVIFIGIQPAWLHLGRDLSKQVYDTIAVLADKVTSALTHKSSR